MNTNDLRARAANLRDRQGPERERRAPPRDTGERLATIQRSDTEQIRIAWDAYKPPAGPPRPYLAISLWTLGRDGNWYPSKGISIRLRELATLADGVAAAIDRAEEHAAKRGDRTPQGGA